MQIIIRLPSSVIEQVFEKKIKKIGAQVMIESWIAHYLIILFAAFGSKMKAKEETVLTVWLWSNWIELQHIEGYVFGS